jgi:hypothetical protein
MSEELVTLPYRLLEALLEAVRQREEPLQRPVPPSILRDKPEEHLILSVRSANTMKNENIRTVDDLVRKTESELLRVPNFGRKSLRELKEVLAEKNLHLGMTDAECEAWTPAQELPNPLPRFQRYTPADAARTQQIGEAYAAGLTLEEIGKQHDLTRERIRQILLRSGLKRIRDEVEREEMERMRGKIRAEFKARARKAARLVRGGMSINGVARKTGLTISAVKAACRRAGVRSHHGRWRAVEVRKARVLELRAQGMTNDKIIQVMRSEGDSINPNWMVRHCPKRTAHKANSSSSRIGGSP